MATKQGEPEEWRPVKLFPGYEVSSLGRVRSVDRVIQHRGRDRMRRGKVMSLYPHRGCWHVGMCSMGRRQSVAVHLLVLRAFIGERSQSMKARFIDGNRKNASASNLMWTKYEFNINRRNNLAKVS